MKRAVCIATISATMLGSLPYSAPLMAYAKSMSAEVDSTGACLLYTSIPMYTDKQIAEDDAAQLEKTVGDLSSVMTDFTLPVKGDKGSVITWESDKMCIRDSCKMHTA